MIFRCLYPGPRPAALLTGVALVIVAGGRPCAAGDVYWQNPAGGSWGTASNWVGGAVPGASDNAYLAPLSGAYTTQVTDTRVIQDVYVGSSTNATAVTLNLTTATFTLNGTLSTQGGGKFQWSGGLLRGAGTLNGDVTVNGGGKTLTDLTLQNAGQWKWLSGTIRPVETGFSTLSAALTNTPAGQMDFKDDGTAFDIGTYPSTRLIVNQGTLRKSGGAITATAVNWAVTFAAGGAIDAQTGNLNFSGGGTLGNGTTTFTGAGQAALAGGTFAIPDGGTFRPVAASGVGLYWAGAILSAGPSGGTLNGTLTVVTGGGSGGAGAIASTTLLNAGTINWLSGSIGPTGNGFSNNPAALTNAPTGLLDFRADGTAFRFGSFPTTLALVNNGVLRKSGGNVSNTTVNWDVNSAGALDLRTGKLVLGQTLVMSSSATLETTISGPTAVSSYAQLQVNGAITLDSPTLTLHFAGYQPTAASKFFVLVNGGASPITGTFAGLPNGATGQSDGYSFQISYFGNANTQALTGGNSVVLYNFVPVPEPAGCLGLAVLACAVFSRRRPLFSHPASPECLT